MALDEVVHERLTRCTYSLRIVRLYRSAVAYLSRMTPITDLRPDSWSHAIVYTRLSRSDADGSRCRIYNYGGICSCEVRFIGERWIIDDNGNVLAQLGFRRAASSVSRRSSTSPTLELSSPRLHVAIVAAGLVTAYTRSAWPDLVVGLGIALMNADAAREIYQLAREEHRTTFS